MSRRRWIECEECGDLVPEEESCSSCGSCIDCCECDDELFSPAELGFDPEDYDVPLTERRRDA